MKFEFDFESLLKGVVIGILSAFVVIYSLRPYVKNPEWCLYIHENPWLIVVLAIMAYYLFLWDSRIGILLVLIIIGLYMDIILILKDNKIM
jgi:hypothetical protein